MGNKDKNLLIPEQPAEVGQPTDLLRTITHTQDWNPNLGNQPAPVTPPLPTGKLNGILLAPQAGQGDNYYSAKPSVTPEQMVQAGVQLHQKQRALVNNFLNTAKKEYVKKKAQNDVVSAQALEDARKAYPGVPDAQLTSWAQQRASHLTSQIEDQKNAEAQTIPDQTIKHLLGLNTMGDMSKALDSRKNTLERGEQWVADNPNASAFDKFSHGVNTGIDAATAIFHDKYGDDAPVMDKDRNLTPQFKRLLYDMADGQLSNYKDVGTHYLNNKIAALDNKPTIVADVTGKAMNDLHDFPERLGVGEVPVLSHVLRSPYYLASSALSGVKAAVKTGATLGFGITGNNEQYADWLKNIEQVQTQGVNEGQPSLSNPDALIGATGRFMGEMEALGGLGRLGNATPVTSAFERAGLNNELGAATTFPGTTANKMYEGVSRALGKLSDAKLPVYLDNVISTGKMFYPSMYADYYSDALHKGYSPDQAEDMAAKRATIAISAMALGNWAGAGKSFADRLPQEILNGADRATANGLFSKIGGFTQKALAKADIKNAAIGGLGMASSAFMDGVQDHYDAVNRGEVAPDAPINYDAIINKAGESGLVGFLTMGLSHVVSGHGKLVETPQAAAIYAAATDPANFNRAVNTEIEKQRITPQQGEALKGLVSRISDRTNGQPSLLEQGYKATGKPEHAVKWAIEQARLQETAKAITDLSSQTTAVPITGEDGKVEHKVYALDPTTGQQSEALGKDLSTQIADLTAKAAESNKALQQLEEGSLVRGRTVSGDELLRLTSRFTPEGGLTTEQAKQILSNGPYTSDLVDISRYGKDKEIADLSKEMADGKSDFKPANANDAILATDGSIIDGKKRIAYALANGQTALQVVRPRTMQETAGAVADARESTIGSGVTPVPEHADVQQKVQDAFEAGLEREATDEDRAKGLTTPTVRALYDAAKEVADLPKEEAVDLLQKTTPVSPADAEQIYNVAHGKPVESVFEKAAPEEQAPTPQKEEYAFAARPDVADSPLWDKEAGAPKEGVTAKDLDEYVLTGEVPKHLEGLKSVEDLAQNVPHETFEETPELAAAKDELKTVTDEPTIAAFEQRRANEVEKSDPIVEGIEGKAESESEADLVAAIEAADKFIGEGRANADIRADEQPQSESERRASPSGEQTSIVRGRTNFLASLSEINRAGWAKKDIVAFTQHLKAKFGDATIAVVNREQAKALGAHADVESWIEDGVLYINIESPHLRPSAALEEAAHLWIDWTRTNATAIHDKGIELAKSTPLFKYMEALRTGADTSPHEDGLTNDEKDMAAKYVDAYGHHADPLYSLANEVLAKGIRTEGKSFTPEADTRKAFGKWLQSLWAELKDAFGFSKLTTVKFAQLDFKAFTQKAAEEIGSGRNLTKRIKEGKVKGGLSRAELQQQAQDNVEAHDRLDATRTPVTNPLGEGTHVIEAGLQKDKPATDDPVINAIGKGGGVEIAAVIKAKNPALYGKLEAIAGDQLPEILDNPAAAPKEMQDALGMTYTKKRGGIIEKMDAGLMKDALTILSDVMEGGHSPEEIVDGLKSYHEALQQREADHAAAIQRGKENQKAGEEKKLGKNAQTFVDALASGTMDGSIRYQRDIDALAKEHGIGKDEVANLQERATDKMLGDKMYSLSQSPKDEREDLLKLLNEAADSDVENFHEQAITLIQNAYREGVIDKDTGVTLTTGIREAKGDETKIYRLLDKAKGMLLNEGTAQPKEAPKKEERSPTALKNEVTDKELTERGMAPRMKQASEGDYKNVWNEVTKMYDEDPTVGSELVNGQHGKKFAPTTLENAILLHERIDLQNQLDKAEIAKVAADKSNNNEESVRLTQLTQRLEDQLRKTYDVISTSGTESSDAFRFRQQMAKEDYSFVNMERKATAAKGSPLTETEKADIRKKVDRVKKASEKAEQHEAKGREKKAKKAAGQQWERTKSAARTGNKKTRLSSILDKYRAKFGVAPKPGGDKMYSLSIKDAEGEDVPRGEVRNMVREVYQYFAAEEPHLSVEAATAKVKEALADILPEATETEIRDVYSGYGETKEPNSNPIAKVEREWKSQARLVSSLELALAGESPLKSGFQRGEQSERVRELWKKVRTAMAENGIITTDPDKQLKSALAAAKRATRNSIEDLNRQVLAKKRDPKVSSGVTPDTELLGLRVERDRLREELDKLDGKRGLTDEQRMALTQKILERAIARKKEAIVTGQVDAQHSTPLTNDKIKELQAESKELTRIIDEMRKEKAPPPKTDEQKATEAAIRAAKKRIEELTGLIDTDTIKQGGKPSKVDKNHPELQALRAERERLQGEYDKMMDDAKPQKTPEEIATERAIKTKQRQLNDIHRRINDLELTKQKKQSLVDKDNQDLIDLSEAYQQSKDYLNDLRKDAGVTDAEKLERWKNTIRRNIDKVNERRANKVYENPPRINQVLDTEGTALQAEYERAKRELDEDIAKYRYDNKKTYEKVFDAANKFQLASKISGIYVLGKLLVMDITSPITRALDDFGGHIASYVPGLKGIGDKAYSEGRMNVNAEVEAYAKGFVHGFKQIPQILKGGRGDLRTIYDKENGRTYEKKWKADLIFHVHEALKNPTYEAAFGQTVTRMAYNLQRAGIDITDAVVKEKIMNTAHEAGLRAIYANDNMYARAIKGLITTIERPIKGQDRATAGQRFVGFLIHTLVPVNRVPSNILGEIATRIGGTAFGTLKMIYKVGHEAATATDVEGYRRVTGAWQRMVDNLTPEQCDGIYRMFKKGNTGLALLLLGALFNKNIGGKRNSDAEEGEIKEGEIQFGETAVPKWMLENTGIQAMEYGATAKRLYDNYIDEDMHPQSALAWAGFKSYMGIAAEVPFVNAVSRVSSVLNAKGSDRAASFASDWTKSNFVPSILQDAAKMSDKDKRGFFQGDIIQRQPQKASKVGFFNHTWQKIKTGIPGLRQTVNQKGKNHP